MFLLHCFPCNFEATSVSTTNSSAFLKIEVFLLWAQSIGDFNAYIGEETVRSAYRIFGCGKTNARGEILLDLIVDNKPVGTKTCSRHHDGQKYTCIAPRREWRTSIDFFAVKQQDRKACLDSRALRSAECGSDHQLVGAKIKGRAWRQGRTHKSVKRRRKLGVKRSQSRRGLRAQGTGEVGGFDTSELHKPFRSV